MQTLELLGMRMAEATKELSIWLGLIIGMDRLGDGGKDLLHIAKYLEVTGVALAEGLKGKPWVLVKILAEDPHSPATLEMSLTCQALIVLDFLVFKENTGSADEWLSFLELVTTEPVMHY